MGFIPTEEQQLIDDTVARLLDKQWDPRREMNTQSSQMAGGTLWKELNELGLLGLALPESAGGGGMGPAELSILCRRFGRHQVRAPFLASQVLAGTALAHAPAGPKRDALLAQLAGGAVTLTLATLESDAGYDHRLIEAQASRAGDSLSLSGCKRAVMDAGIAEHVLVSCRLDDAPALLVVDAASSGLRVESYAAFDGTSLATVYLDAVAVSDDAILARGDAALTALDAALAAGALAAASETLGACEGALERTLDYLRIREQFGTVIGRFQALQHRAADLHAELEMLRSLVAGACQSLAENPAHGDAYAALALAVPVGDHVCREAIQMHGGIGMTQELGIGRYLLRVNALSRLFGDAAHNGGLYLATLEV
ncbi:acyl-CoA dehydrogenase family protein [Alloalcanivorax mobilis]|uniref:acyl-CoA dehydrogenase family protein n=1 Tax=Alloalcanivorax mobilis TaxID=2019569 RepID=UPI000B5B3DC6|nr:acyl-CoA dehydrogenase [Alloalcanivorax mobilis]ASK35662.1 hypothetical protein CEK62_15375 [Alcanivorax sp. N3-2A]